MAVPKHTYLPNSQTNLLTQPIIYAIFRLSNKGGALITGLQEKRIFPRVRLRAPVYYQVRGNPAGGSTLSDDISLGGIALTADSFLPTETIIGLKIFVLSRVIQPIGKVVWLTGQPHSAKYRIGIRFVEIDPREKEYLSDYIILQRWT